MWEQQLKAVCQLHRLIILLSATFALQTLWPIGPTWWAKGAFLLALTAAVFSLMANEFILKLAKKFRDAPPQTMTMMSLSLPLAASLYSDVMYGLSGNMLAFWTGLLTLMSPYLLGRPALVPILALRAGGR
jgi:cation transport ATPase